MKGGQGGVTRYWSFVSCRRLVVSCCCIIVSGLVLISGWMVLVQCYCIVS